MNVNANVIAEIKAEAEQFGFAATKESIARDYFNRMSPIEKAEVIALVGAQKGVAALSRACVSKVAEFIEA